MINVSVKILTFKMIKKIVCNVECQDVKSVITLKFVLLVTLQNNGN